MFVTLKKFYHINLFVRCFRRIFYIGRRYFCPVCRSHLRKFIKSDPLDQEGTICPVCLSHKRHRLTWMYILDESGILSPPVKKILHASPEPSIEKHLRKNKFVNYYSSDYLPGPMIRADLTELCFRNSEFDIIIASHVLEHIPDDRKAMKELFRILSRPGTAFLMVPVDSSRKTTFEDLLITDPEERKKHFGQSDHVRIYGTDYYKRLEDAGFTVQRIKLPVQEVPDLLRKYNISSDEEIILALKR